ncbi:MAG: energy-coupling factor ABC transporter ATP-binding protein [Anaerolineae bacterium]
MPLDTGGIVVERLEHRYEEGVPALNGVDLMVPDGAFLAVIGQNGSGKTTLAKHLNGLLKPSSGRVCVYGQDTRHTSVAALARVVGYVFQNPDHQIFCSTVREELAFGPRNLGLASRQLDERVQDALAAFELAEFADAPPAMLGLGLRRKVSVAAVYAMRPRVLVLDEPTAGLDWRSVCGLMERVNLLNAAGSTIILVTHDMRLVAEHARQVLVMHQGRSLLSGTPRQVFGDTEALAVAHLAPPPITQLARCLAGYGLPLDILTVDEFRSAYARALGLTS